MMLMIQVEKKLKNYQKLFVINNRIFKNKMNCKILL